MIAEMLKDWKIFKVDYDKSRHTYMVNWGPKDAAYAHSRLALTHLNFPSHTPLSFLDEKVRIGEEVMVWLKDESVLKSEGWSEYRDGRRMKSDNSPFIIGKDKRRLLGTGIKCRIGISEKIEPYAVYKDWRFSPNEIKSMLKLDFVKPPIYAELATPDGVLTFDPQNRSICLPDGHSIPLNWLPALKQLTRMAGL